MAKRELTEEEKKTVDNLNSKYDGLTKWSLVVDNLVVVRAANTGELQRFNDKVARTFTPKGRNSRSDSSMYEAQLELALSCIVHPSDLKERKALIDKRPGLVGTAASIAEELASDGIEEFEGN